MVRPAEFSATLIGARESVTIQREKGGVPRFDNEM